MIGQPIVSCIIIFYNAEKFLEEAIQSVFDQIYENWELLLVDDGSTDNGTGIAKHYAQQYPQKVLYLEHEDHQNRGKSCSRNLGIYNAKGDYIAFLDADDVFLPFKLDKQVKILQSYPEAAMVYGNTLYWHSWTGNPEDSQKDYMPELGIQLNSLVQPPSLLQLWLDGRGAVPCICSFIVQRQVVENIGGFEESIQHLYEDQAFLAKIFSTVPVFVEDGCGEKYRQRDDSSWHISVYTGEDYQARFVFLNWLERYLIEQQLKDTKILHALQKQLYPYRYPKLSQMTTRTRRLIGRIKAAFKAIGRHRLLTKL